MKVYVYRAYDALDRLLYVGCSVNVEQRLASHQKDSPWSLFYSRVEIAEYPSRSEGEAAEAEAIATEFPRWNIQGRSPDHPEGFTRSRGAAWLAVDMDIWRRWKNLTEERARLEQKLARNSAERAALDAQIMSHPAIVARDSVGAA